MEEVHQWHHTPRDKLLARIEMICCPLERRGEKSG